MKSKVIIIEGNKHVRAARLRILERELADAGKPWHVTGLPPATLSGFELGTYFFRPMAAALTDDIVCVLDGGWNAPEIGERLDLARKRMLERVALTAELANVGPGAGRWAPGEVHLVIADRPNTAKIGSLKHRLPYVSFFGIGAAADITIQLERAELAERDLYWINAYDASGAPTPGDFLSALRPRSVLTLGELAEHWSAEHSLAHARAFRPGPEAKALRLTQNWP